MLAYVLKAFPYAHDHHTVKTLEKGDVVEIDEGVYEGLEAAKFIREPSDAEADAAAEGAVVVHAPVEIPEGWEKLTWFKMKALADRVNRAPVKDKKTATAVIQAELAARQAAE